ncbi:hypothetical protein DQ04_02241010 [Trypanosoma grayi]|uniref:hypothetical protein n=1 Tax=Trypanosoma grayi TaxID=71804 RepID=UPI0004F40982|nr:hypothetical protein DQ04_02241010 [Trypanosoma grayi]KEG11823.1 hypothetical protein DQ04_02241010 [Trypanosoma grayi]
MPAAGTDASSPTESSKAADVFGSATNTYEALEVVCVANSDKYADVMLRLSNPGGGARLAGALLQAVQQLVPSRPLTEVFGSTKAPLLLLFVPALLFRASVLLGSPHTDIVGPNKEWDVVSAFLLATQGELLASPGQRVVHMTHLPPPPTLPSVKHTPSWATILTETVLADFVSLPPDASQRSSSLTAANFGAVLYAATCGLVHLLQAIMAAPPRVVCGMGTLEFLKATIRLLLSPTVLIYGSKENNLQTCIASLLLFLRSALATREAVGEIRQEHLMEQWSKCMQCWFDSATQSSNTVCMQLLFPYMLSPDITWNI